MQNYISNIDALMTVSGKIFARGEFIGGDWLENQYTDVAERDAWLERHLSQGNIGPSELESPEIAVLDQVESKSVVEMLFPMVFSNLTELVNLFPLGPFDELDIVFSGILEDAFNGSPEPVSADALARDLGAILTLAI